MRSLCLLACALLAACGATGDDPSALADIPRPWIEALLASGAVPTDAHDADAQPDTAGDIATGAEDAFDLSGTFAMEAIVRGKLVIDLDSRQIFLVRFRQEGTHLEQTTTNCAIELPSVEGLAEIILPDAVLELLRGRPFESAGDFLSGTDLGAEYRPDAQAFTLGVDFEGRDAFEDPLPTDQNLSLALDEDGDGHPGVTLQVDTAACSEIEYLYVAMRSVVRMDGRVEGSDRVAGSVNPTLDQVVLGTSHACLQIAANLTPEIQEGSSFRGVRVDGAHGSPDLDADGDGTITCDELEPELEALFPE